MLDVTEDLTVVPTDDHGNPGVIFEPHRFDVKERGFVQIVTNDSPLVRRRETLNEIPDVSGF